jgi:preprotein translocase subunit SecA
MVRHFLREFFANIGSGGGSREAIGAINARRREFRQQSDDELKAAGKRAQNLTETVAVAAVAAERLLGLDMFDVQLQSSLVLSDGKIAEMQTGEGKTLAAVPAVVWYAKSGKGVHVMTVNDYLARREGAGRIARSTGRTSEPSLAGSGRSHILWTRDLMERRI